MLRAVEYKAKGGIKMHGHSHPAWHLCAVLEGAFLERTESGDVECAAGAVRLSAPHTTHNLEFHDDGAKCLIVEATGPFWNRVLARPLASRRHVFAKLDRNLTPPSVAGSFVCSPPAAEWLGALLAAAEFSTVDTGEWRLAEEARLRLELEPLCSISEIAKKLGLNREDFARQFRRRFGLQPSEHRALSRIRSVVDRLKDPDVPLAEIALNCGYTHQSHMTNAFSAILGTTPGAWRARNSPESNLQEHA
ncbi:MAG: helix-turn-helix transcriptional regulator [Rhizomicrobium sp.]|jgi:AraC-like DNA-binding protein